MTKPALDVAFGDGYLLAVMRCFTAALKEQAPKPVLEAILAETNQNPALKAQETK